MLKLIQRLFQTKSIYSFKKRKVRSLSMFKEAIASLEQINIEIDEEKLIRTERIKQLNLEQAILDDELNENTIVIGKIKGVITV